MRALALLPCLAVLGALGARAAPRVGPAQPMDAPVIGKAFNAQYSVAAARGPGGMALVVWADLRNGRDSDIYGTRIAPDGRMMDPLGIPVSVGRLDQGFPSVAWDGEEFWVVWEDTRRTFAQGVSGIFGARVLPDGTVVDPAGVALVEGPGLAPVQPALAFVDGVLQLAWENMPQADNGQLYSVMGQSFDVAGRPLGAAVQLGCRVLYNDTPDRDVRLAATAAGAVATWSRQFTTGCVDPEQGGLWYGLLSPQGNTIAAQPRSLYRGSSQAFPFWAQPTVREGKVEVVINSYLDDEANGNFGIGFLLAQLDPTLTADGGATALLPYAPCNGVTTSAAIGQGESLLIPHTESCRNLAEDIGVGKATVGAGGWSWEDNVVAREDNPQVRPVLVPLGNGFFSAWADLREAGYRYNSPPFNQLIDVYGTALSAQLAPVTPGGSVLSQSYNVQDRPAVAGNPRGFLTAWQDWRSGAPDVYVQRLGLDGTVLGDGGFNVAQRVRFQADPDVAWAREGYLVVWADLADNAGTWDVWARRFDSEGLPLGEAFGLVTSQHSQLRPRLASNGEVFLLVYEDGSDSADRRLMMRAQVLDARGRALGPSALLSPTVAAATGDVLQGGARATWDGKVFRVAWLDGRRQGAPATGQRPMDIFTSRVSVEGEVLDGDGVLATQVTRPRSDLAIAARDDALLMTWVDRFKPERPSIYGALVVANAVVPGELALFDPLLQATQAGPSVLALPGRFVVAFEDRPTPDTSDLREVEVSFAGEVRGEATLSAATAPEQRPSLASGLPGALLLGYGLRPFDPRLASERVHTRALAVLDEGNRCDAASECASGFCADGVCCRSACEGEGDCQSCLLGEGGPGVCSALAAGAACGAPNACGAQGRCDGVAQACAQAPEVPDAGCKPPLPPAPEPEAPKACGCSASPSASLLALMLAALRGRAVRRRGALCAMCVGLAAATAHGSTGAGANAGAPARRSADAQASVAAPRSLGATGAERTVTMATGAGATIGAPASGSADPRGAVAALRTLGATGAGWAATGAGARAGAPASRSAEAQGSAAPPSTLGSISAPRAGAERSVTASIGAGATIGALSSRAAAALGSVAAPSTLGSISAPNTGAEPSHNSAGATIVAPSSRSADARVAAAAPLSLGATGAQRSVTAFGGVGTTFGAPSILGADGRGAAAPGGLGATAAPALPRAETQVLREALARWRSDKDGAAIAEGDLHRARLSAAALELTVSPSRTPLSLSTVAFGRGTPPAVERTAWSTRGALAERRAGPCTEELEHRPDGLEQRWRCAAAPPGTGALVVEVELLGASFDALSSRGHRFLAPGGTGLTYGAARWIDADGKESPVPTVLGPEGRLTLTVSQALLERTRWPAVLDPELSPETPLLGAAMPWPALQPQTALAVAASRATALAGWLDERAQHPDVFVGELGAATAEISLPRRLTFTPAARAHFALASDGTGFLAVWTEAASSLGPFALRARALDAQGSPAGPELTLAPASANVSFPAVAFDGAAYRVVARSAAVGQAPSVLGVTLAPNLPPASQRLADCSAIAQPAVAAVGGVTWVAFESPQVPARVQLLSWGAAPRALAPAGTGLQRAPALAAGADGTLAVAWEERSTGEPDLHLLRNALDAASPERVVPGPARAPALAFEGGTLWLAFLEGAPRPTLAVQRFGPASPLDAAPLSLVPASLAPRAPAFLLGQGPSRALAFLTAPGSGATAGRLLKLTEPLVAGGSSWLSRVASGQRSPALLGSAQGHLVVFEDTRSGRDVDLYAVELSTAGALSEGFVVSAEAGDQQAPTVAAAGDSVLAAWIDGRVPGRALVLGALLSAQRADELVWLSLSRWDFARPQLAGGRSFLLVLESPQVPFDGNIVAVQVSTLGLPIIGSTLFPNLGTYSNPKVAVAGERYLVAAEGDRSGQTAGSDVVAVLVSAQGTPQSPNGAQLSTLAGRERLLQVASDGKDFLVLWQETFTSALRAARVGSDGELRDPRGLAVLPEALSAALAFDGTRYLVAAAQRAPSGAAVAARWVSVDGALSQVVPLGTLPGTPSADLQLSLSGPGEGALAYSRYEPTVANERVRLVTFSARPLGTACSEGDSCLSGFCVDGVCCDTACGTEAQAACAVCSVARGAAVGGTCAPAPSNVTCRAAAAVCDAVERCDGQQLSCPADVPAPSGSACEGGTCSGAGQCQPAVEPPPKGPSGCGCTGASGGLGLLALAFASRRPRRPRRGRQPGSSFTAGFHPVRLRSSSVTGPTACALLGSRRPGASTPDRRTDFRAVVLALTLLGCAGTVRPDAGALPDGGPDAGVRDGGPSDAGAPAGAFGERCTADGQCLAGRCLPSGVCSQACTARSDCLATPEWSCSAQGTTPGFCQCVRLGSGEACDGRDNDCNGRVDDGALCDSPGTVCTQGRCTCPVANLCEATCVDLRSDRLNCGACGVRCEGQCDEGVCGCQSGRTVCGGQCVLPASDSAHCGACGNACGAGEACVEAQCVLDRSWALWPMPEASALVVGFDTVQDSVTGLTWTREPLGRASFSSAHGLCDASRVGGASDWRLPSRVELVSLLDYSRSPSALPDAFLQPAGPTGTWTSGIRFAGQSNFREALVVDVATGAFNSIFQGELHWVRCVR